MVITIRSLKAQDRQVWEALYYGYGEFYQVAVNAQKLDTIWSWIFSEQEAFYCLIAKDEEGQGVGFMHYREMASPLRGAKVGFLDDLFVAPAQRAKGVAEALFQALKNEAKDHGWPMIRWLTGDDNYRARAVYDRVATRTMWLTYQMDIDEGQG